MIKHKSKLAGGAVVFLALAATTFAEVKINDNLSVNGYAVGSYQLTDPTPGTSADSFQVDTALLGTTVTFKPVSAVASVLYTPSSTPGSSEVTLLDAYVTYDAGGGMSVTGGKFLSYMGYESYYPIFMDQITYANGQFLAPIPGYHSGVRLDFSDDTSGAGIALVDSVYSPFGSTRGDGELKHNGGLEAFYSYKGIKDVVLWFGTVYDSKGGFEANKVTMYDFWASYTVSKEVRIAGEYAYKDGGLGAKGYNWITFLDYSLSDKESIAFRLSGEQMSNGGPGFTKYTICPGVAVTGNLTVRAEYSYIDYKKYPLANSVSYFGVQAIFKF